MRDRRGESSNVSAPSIPIASNPNTSTPVGPTTGGSDALGDWYAGDSSFEGNNDEISNREGSGRILGGSPEPKSEPTSDSPAVLPVSSGNTTGALQSSGLSWEQPKPGLTTAEKEKLHSLMAGVVVRVNVLLLGLGVNIFGRIPAEPAPEDTALLEKAWQLQLNEWFANTEISPKILIVAASAGLGIGMYVQGEKKPPKVIIATDNADGSRAK